jgi:hypothetical protein
MSKLDKEEKEMLDAFEGDRLKRSKGAKNEISRHNVYAEAMFKKRCARLLGTA